VKAITNPCVLPLQPHIWKLLKYLKAGIELTNTKNTEPLLKLYDKFKLLKGMKIPLCPCQFCSKSMSFFIQKTISIHRYDYFALNLWVFFFSQDDTHRYVWLFVKALLNRHFVFRLYFNCLKCQTCLKYQTFEIQAESVLQSFMALVDGTVHGTGGVCLGGIYSIQCFKNNATR